MSVSHSHVEHRVLEGVPGHNRHSIERKSTRCSGSESRCGVRKSLFLWRAAQRPREDRHQS